MTKSVKLIGIPENNFLCIFILASSQGVYTFFCLWRVNKKLPQGETSQNAFQRSRSISYKWKKLKNTHVKMGISTFNTYVPVSGTQSMLFLLLFCFTVFWINAHSYSWFMVVQLSQYTLAYPYVINKDMELAYRYAWINCLIGYLYCMKCHGQERVIC